MRVCAHHSSTSYRPSLDFQQTLSRQQEGATVGKENPAMALGAGKQKQGPGCLSGAAVGLLWFLLSWKWGQTLGELSVTNWQLSVTEVIVFLPGLPPVLAVWLPAVLGQPSFLIVCYKGVVSQACCCRLWVKVLFCCYFYHLFIQSLSCIPERYVLS